MKDYRSNHDVDRVKALLARTPAPPLDRPGPAEPTANDRRARMRRGATGAALALAAATVVVGPHFVASSPTTNESTDPANGVIAPSGTPPAALDPSPGPCPGAAIHDRQPPSSVARLASGAELVRLCRAVGPGHRSRWAAPADALVTNVDGFLRDVNAAPEVAPADCPRPPPGRLAALGARQFILTVSYPRGRTVS
ncbi:MAG: hypothetical protein H0V07_02835, partial [Propionibacteriales bacterium]|nr:hypothetical protein [Propionibacteriales bacterium]